MTCSGSDDPQRRVLLVGDIHGMYDHFMYDSDQFASRLLNSFTSNLLEKASYDPKFDVLIHVGDVVTKAPHKHSLKMLAYLASNNITGVRGNHDQKVIEWHGWIHWIRGLPGGTRWLRSVYLKWREEKRRGTRLNLWLNKEKQRDSGPWWKKIPKGWKLFSEHFDIAHDMTDEQYDYLRSLPLMLYVPSAHVFIVHAGLLSSNPTYPFNHPTQPLARIPSLLSKNSSPARNDTYPLLRRLQELSVLNDVPQNTVPWNVLNMRTVHDGTISRQVTFPSVYVLLHLFLRDTHGQSWTNVWNHDMSRCHGFDIHAEGVARDLLHCYPSTVVYGHSASRGLDIKRWSIGLDTGCVGTIVL